MKKRIISILLIVFLGIGVVLRVNAADATAKLKTSSTKLDPGETFTVTFEASCKEGINGIQTVSKFYSSNRYNKMG